MKDFTPKDVETLFPPDFASLVYCCARAGAGKSHLCTYLLSLPSLRDRYSLCVCVSPSSNLGKNYRQFPAIAIHKTPDQLQETVEKLKAVQMKILAEGNTPGYILLLIDDCLTSVGGLHSCTWLADLVSTRRHLKIHIWLLSQSTRGIQPCVRDQCSVFICVGPPRTLQDRRFIIENYMCREMRGTKRETIAHAESIMDSAFKRPFSALMIACCTQCNCVEDNCWSVLAPAKLPKYKMNLRLVITIKQKEQERVQETPYDYRFLTS